MTDVRRWMSNVALGDSLTDVQWLLYLQDHALVIGCSSVLRWVKAGFYCGEALFRLLATASL